MFHSKEFRVIYDKKRTVQVAKQVISMEAKIIDYANNVHIPFENLLTHMRLFWDPSVEKDEEEIMIFKNACYSTKLEGTPLGILNYIYVHTVRNCRNGLTPKQISLLGKFVPLLRQIRMKLNSEIDKIRFDETGTDLTILFTELDSKEAEKLLLKMQQSIDTTASYSSDQEALSLLKTTLYPFEAERNSRCLLQDIITGKNFHRKSIEEFQNIVRLDVLQLMTFGSICANLSLSGSPSRMDWYQKELLRKVVPIMENVQLYVSNELEKSFPKIEIGLVTTKIDEMRLVLPVTDNATIFRTMVEVFNHLNQYGNRKYYRQGFISTSLQNQTDYTLRCYIENCFALWDYMSLHVVVTRIDTDNDENRAVGAYEWLFNVDPYARTNAATVLEKYIDLYYNIDQVSWLLERFEKRHFPLTNEDFFHNVAILRDYGPTGECGVKTAAFYYPFGNYTNTCVVRYYFAGTVWHYCESYIIYLFV